MKTKDRYLLILIGGLGSLEVCRRIFCKLGPEFEKIAEILTTGGLCTELVNWVAETGINMEPSEFRHEFIERFTFIQLSVRESKPKEA